MVTVKQEQTIYSTSSSRATLIHIIRLGSRPRAEPFTSSLATRLLKVVGNPLADSHGAAHALALVKRKVVYSTCKQLPLSLLALLLLVSIFTEGRRLNGENVAFLLMIS